MTRTAKVFWGVVLFGEVFAAIGTLATLLVIAWTEALRLVRPYFELGIFSGVFAVQVGAVVGLAFGLIFMNASQETLQRASIVVACTGVALAMAAILALLWQEGGPPSPG